MRGVDYAKAKGVYVGPEDVGTGADDFALDFIKNIGHVPIFDVTDLRNGGGFDALGLISGCDARPPFPRFVVEWKYSSGDYTIVDVVTAGDTMRLVVYWCRKDYDYVLQLGDLQVQYPEDLGKGRITRKLTKYVQKKCTDKEKTDAVNEQVDSKAANALGVCVMLNAKNITYIKHEPSAAEQRKHRKKRKAAHPLVTYHELAVRVGDEVRPLAQASNEPSQRLKRIHLCRGHVARYTEDNPLFGKYTGQFWRPAHVRGNKKRGIAHKDYKVESV